MFAYRPRKIMSTRDETITYRLRPVRPRRDEPQSRGLAIVVIEDNDDFSELLSTLLRLRGHTVSTARDGRTGLSLLLESGPDAAFIDIDLPGLDGHSIARRTRAAELERPPYLIAMTGFGQHDDRQRSLAAGFDGHLVKPVTIEVIERALRAAPIWCRSVQTATS